MNSKSTKKTRVVIAGGGFAGLYAAKYLDKTLARNPEIDVTLVSRENFVLFTPMLHEVAAGDLSPADIVNPLRRILHHVNVIQADVRAIDLATRKIRCLAGLGDVELEFEFDHLLLALGSETNFFDMQGVRDWAVTMKNLSDAALLRNRMVALLEDASLRKDEAAQRELLTFVIAGGGFSGTETTGAVNDFVRETAKFYPPLKDELIRVVVVHPGKFLLPELGEELGHYAESKLLARKVEVIKSARVANYDGSVVELSNGMSIPEQPENFALIGDLALTNMAIGDKAAALALAERTMAANPVEKDAFMGPFSMEIRARVAAQMGERDGAIAALQKLLSIPYRGPFSWIRPLTPALLRLDPMFDPLRNDPRFQKLIVESQPH
jgi:NADH dehydrogenase FAD-containing subunit